MTSTTLDQDKQRFAEWRSQPKQRQPIPDELWRLACNHISTLGISRVAREFRLNDTKLREKAVQGPRVVQETAPAGDGAEAPAKKKAAAKKPSSKKKAPAKAASKKKSSGKS